MSARIRAKVAAVVAVPLVALVAISGVQATGALGAADRIERDADVALVLFGPDSVTAALQRERAWTWLDLLGLLDQVELGATTYEATRRATDTAITSLRNVVGDLDPHVREALAPALDALDGLDEPRRAFETHVGPRELDNIAIADEVWTGYTEIAAAFVDAAPAAATEVDRAELRTGVEIAESAARRSEGLAAGARAVLGDLADEDSSDERRTRLVRAIERVSAAERRIEQLAAGPYAAITVEPPDGSAVPRTRELLGEHLAGDDVAAADVVAEVGARGGAASITEQAAAVLAGEADARSDQARREALVLALVAAGAVVVAVAAAVVAARSIAGRWRDEASAPAASVEAGPAAEPDAPEPDTSGPARPDPAADARFLDLGRRNDDLLRRQLELIEALERSETAPDALDALFRLDHLATRMRRNAESQAVLAGGPSPRRWDVPVAVDAVVRAGIGEVEEHARVRIRHLDPAAIDGDAVADLSHVVAELVENALTASAPGAPVRVEGRRSPEGYVITVADQGPGMPDPELEAANRRLDGEPDEPEAEGGLGHHVAGHLARRHGVDVRLDPGRAGGIVATVAVPSSLVTSTAPVPVAEAAAPSEDADVPDEPEEPETGADEVDPIAAPGPEDAAFDAWFAGATADGLGTSSSEALAEALGDDPDGDHDHLDELRALAALEALAEQEER